MNIESIEISKLSFDPANARKHSKKNLDAIKGSLKKFGQRKNIVIDANNVVVAGNGTLAAAIELGWTHIYADRTELTGPEAIAFALADNRTAELAEWDLEPLQKTLQGLKDIDFDLGSIGFDEDFMEAHTPKVENPGLTDPDEVPEQVETRCKPGDLWILGSHRLLCGDSTNVQHVERLMDGKKADMVFTDPPYGMNLDADWSGTSAGNHSGNRGGNKYKKVIGDTNDFSPELINSIFANFSDVKEVFLWGADYYAEYLTEKNLGSWIVWDKASSSQGIGTMDALIGSNFELCWSRSKHKRELVRMAHKGLGSVESGKRVHPTQKPAKLSEWFFERWGKPNDLVADLFLGSGSTLIACEKTGRSCYGMEIDPHYCDVIIKRWEDFTGKKAQLSDSLVSVKGSVNG